MPGSDTAPEVRLALGERPADYAGELSDHDLEAVLAGKGGNSNGGHSPLTRMWARFLDERSIHLVSA
jgi:hypothetical protein